jgi:hypothetical protein
MLSGEPIYFIEGEGEAIHLGKYHLPPYTVIFVKKVKKERTGRKYERKRKKEKRQCEGQHKCERGKKGITPKVV